MTGCLRATKVANLVIVRLKGHDEKRSKNGRQPWTENSAVASMSTIDRRHLYNKKYVFLNSEKMKFFLI